jgi:hypothetical protein
MTHLTWRIRIFWREPSPKTVTTGASKLSVSRQLTLSVCITEKNYRYERFSVECHMDPTLEKQMARKGLSHRAKNHYQHRVVLIETVFWKYRQKFVYDFLVHILTQSWLTTLSIQYRFDDDVDDDAHQGDFTPEMLSGSSTRYKIFFHELDVCVWSLLVYRGMDSLSKEE